MEKEWEILSGCRRGVDMWDEALLKRKTRVFHFGIVLMRRPLHTHKMRNALEKSPLPPLHQRLSILTHFLSPRPL